MATDGFPITEEFHTDPAKFHPLSMIIYKCMAGYKFGDPRKLVCDIIMGLFLYGMSRLVNKKLYLVLVIFFKELRNCLNNNAYQIIEKYTTIQRSERCSANEIVSFVDISNKEEEFCAVKSPVYLPLIADIFVKHISNKYPDFERGLAVELIEDFCCWLERKKLTKIRLNKVISNKKNI